jgi:hypothetical protein
MGTAVLTNTCPIRYPYTYLEVIVGIQSQTASVCDCSSDSQEGAIRCLIDDRGEVKHYCLVDIIKKAGFLWGCGECKISVDTETQRFISDI